MLELSKAILEQTDSEIYIISDQNSINPTIQQVISTTGDPVPNLYAAGEGAGGIHGSNRLGGNAVSEVVAMGRLTGINAAKQVDNVA